MNRVEDPHYHYLKPRAVTGGLFNLQGIMNGITPSLRSAPLFWLLAFMALAPFFGADTFAAQSGQWFNVPSTEKSGRAVFRATYTAVTQRFQALKVASAYADLNDQYVEAFFSGKQGGVSVNGSIVAIAGRGATVFFDRPETFARSYMSLVRAAFGQAGGAPEARAQTIQPLQTVNFGSGTIGLPAGWQVLNSYQGCVEAGTQGGYLALGCPQTVIVPPGLPGADPRAVLMLPYADPVTTLGRWAQTPLPLGLGVRVTRIVEQAPVASNAPQGKAAYILFDYVSQNFPFRGLAMIDIMPINEGSYVLYKSMVLLSAETFNKMMPTLWAAWKSWSVNPAVFRQRMDAAIQSMRETSEIISSGYRDRQRSQDNTNLAFNQYIRGTATVENVFSRRRGDTSLMTASEVVREDPVRYRIVPTQELLPR